MKVVSGIVTLLIEQSDHIYHGGQLGAPANQQPNPMNCESNDIDKK